MRLTLVAVDVGIAGVIFWTLTLGFVTNYCTKGVVRARIGNDARTHALPVTTALTVWAVIVRTASRFFYWY